MLRRHHHPDKNKTKLKSVTRKMVGTKQNLEHYDGGNPGEIPGQTGEIQGAPGEILEFWHSQTIVFPDPCRYKTPRNSLLL